MGTLAGLLLVVALTGCHQAGPSPVADNAAAPPSEAPAAAKAPAIPEAAAPVEEPPLAPLPPDPDQWLFVERIEPGARGGWATGSFDKAKNKLQIELRDVERFTIDSVKIEINWEHPVILNINGDVAELRRRENPTYRFIRDAKKGWIVDEPPP
ncbi:MAG: hypothetical protein IT434_03535 [Phycisphaerales bacterium]|nr:hypothetical protein [Phycisphaerales bacterium]